MTAPRVIGLVPHRDRDVARESAGRAIAWFRAHHVEIRVPEGDGIGLDVTSCPPEAFAPGLDLVLSLGGDGTMLRAVDLAYEAGVPVLGVNVGQMGYLTEVEPEDLEDALQRLITGTYTVAERMVPQVTVRSNGPTAGDLGGPHAGRGRRGAPGP